MSTVTGLRYRPVVSNIKTKLKPSSTYRVLRPGPERANPNTPQEQRLFCSSVPGQSEATHMMKHVDPIGALGGLAIMHDVGDEIISGVLVDCLDFFRQVFS